MDTTNHCPLCEQRETEMEELRKAVAVKDDALRLTIRTLNYDRPNAAELIGTINTIEAALSSTPSGMRVVSKEDLGQWLDLLDRLTEPTCYCESDREPHYQCKHCEARELSRVLLSLIGGDDAD